MNDPIKNSVKKRLITCNLIGFIIVAYFVYTNADPAFEAFGFFGKTIILVVVAGIGAALNLFIYKSKFKKTNPTSL